MSASSRAVLMYGYRFLKKDVIKITSIRACKHPIDVGDKFCSECGKPAFIPSAEQLVYGGDFEALPFDVECGNRFIDDTCGDFYVEYYVVGTLIKSGYSNVADLRVFESSPEYQQDLLDKVIELGLDASAGLLGVHLVHNVD